jgi:DNA-binding transcriptional LysR family regulator
VENTWVAHAAFMKNIWCLTPSGESLLTRSYAVLQEIAQLQDEMKPYSEGVRGNVRLYANATAISELLPNVLAKFFTTHPHVTVDLQERLSMEIVQAVRDGLADIGVISALVRADGLETFPYKKDRLVLVVSICHPLAHLSEISFADALEYDFIGLASNSITHSFLKQEVSLLGGVMRQRIQVGSFDAMSRMIEGNVGIGVLPEMVALRHASSMKIKPIKLIDDWAMRELRICVRKKEDLPIYAKEIIALISQVS